MYFTLSLIAFSIIRLLIEFLICAERFKSIPLNVLSLFIEDFGDAKGIKYSVWFNFSGYSKFIM